MILLTTLLGASEVRLIAASDTQQAIQKPFLKFNSKLSLCLCHATIDVQIGFGKRQRSSWL
jgi:hypothetical protein